MIEGLAGGLSGIGAAVTNMATSTGAGASGASAPFSGIFQSMVEQTSALDAKAAQAVSGLLSGQGVEIHDAMIATEKADMAFELALQVRNKAVGAYQQMMAMQF
jgi:flagellar hook-basal body complex protein FliE